MRRLFFVHPVDGVTSVYDDLAQHLLPELALIGLSAPEPPPQTVEDFARHHLETIAREQPRGPYLIAGWAACGIIAFEIGRQLEERGERVERLFLVDTRAPDDTLRDRPTDLVTVAREYSKVLIWRSGERQLPPDLAARFANLSPDRVSLEVLDQLTRLGLPEASLGPQGILQRVVTVQAAIRAYFAYRVQPFSLPLTVFRTTDDLPEHPRPASLGWDRWSAHPIEYVPVPGNHFTAALRENAPGLARAIRSAC